MTHAPEPSAPVSPRPPVSIASLWLLGFGLMLVVGLVVYAAQGGFTSGARADTPDETEKKDNTEKKDKKDEPEKRERIDAPELAGGTAWLNTAGEVRPGAVNSPSLDALKVATSTSTRVPNRT